MPRRPKGFDPLASLLVRPSSDAASGDDAGLDGEDDRTLPPIPPMLEVTDPVFSGPRQASAPSAPWLSNRAFIDVPLPADEDDAFPEVLAAEEMEAPRPELLEVPESRLEPWAAPQKPVEMDAPVSSLPFPESDSVEPPEAPSASPVPSEPEPEPEQEPEPAPSPPPPPGPPADPVALARALGKAAAARAGAPKPSRITAAPEPKAAAPAPAAPRVESSQPMSRMDSLALKATRVRTRSAEDLVRAAVEMEQEEMEKADKRVAARKQQEAEEHPAPARPQRIVEIQALLEQKLRGMGPIEVSNCLVVKERDVLKALWRAHRARFAADGELERVVGAIAVYDGLNHVPDGQLIAAHVYTEASDYLVWLDLRRGALLAAFSDARALFVAG